MMPADLVKRVLEACGWTAEGELGEGLRAHPGGGVGAGGVGGEGRGVLRLTEAEVRVEHAIDHGLIREWLIDQRGKGGQRAAAATVCTSTTGARGASVEVAPPPADTKSRAKKNRLNAAVSTLK